MQKDNTSAIMRQHLSFVCKAWITKLIINTNYFVASQRLRLDNAQDITICGPKLCTAAF